MFSLVLIMSMDGEFKVPKYKQSDEEINDGVNLLISILVRYPEVGSVSFDPETNLLKLTFMLMQTPSKLQFSYTQKIMLDSIRAYHSLAGRTSYSADIKLESYAGVAVITIFRDVNTLSRSEIALIIELLRKQYAEQLVTDYNDSLLEEDLLIQEELIESMLDNMKKNHSEHRLIGIREDGKVLVFNK